MHGSLGPGATHAAFPAADALPLFRDDVGSGSGSGRAHAPSALGVESPGSAGTGSASLSAAATVVSKGANSARADLTAQQHQASGIQHNNSDQPDSTSLYFQQQPMQTTPISLSSSLFALALPSSGYGAGAVVGTGPLLGSRVVSLRSEHGAYSSSSASGSGGSSAGSSGFGSGSGPWPPHKTSSPASPVLRIRTGDALQLSSPTINAQSSNHSSSRSEFGGSDDIFPAHQLQLLRQHDPSSSSLRQAVEAVPPAAATVDGAV
jgi:hypothetical protein